MLSVIYEMFRDVVASDWQTQIDLWSKRIKLFREYHAGDHRSTITAEMAELLRIEQTDVLDRLNANYMQKVIDAMNDRLVVTEMRADSDEAQAWVNKLLDDNRWDELQLDLTESCLSDGDTFMLVSWDDDAKMTKLTQEEAYNGDWGMIPIYSRWDKKTLYAAVKIVGSGYDDDYLVWVYYRDRVETYIGAKDGGDLRPHVIVGSEVDVDDETPHIQHYDADGEDVFPVVHYPNRRNKSTGLGCSELLNAIPLNDVMNRTIQSMVAASELSAFQVAYVIGAPAEGSIKPGTIINIGKDGIPGGPEGYHMPVVGTLTQGSPVPFLEVIDNMVDKISDVTSTPIYLGNSNQSGEALKERDKALVAKSERAQVKLGNKHEDSVTLAARVESVYSGRGVMLERVSAQWKDAQVRNEETVVASAKTTYDVTGDVQLYLEDISEIRGWTEDERTEILGRIQNATLNVLQFAQSQREPLNFDPVLQSDADESVA